MTNHYVFVVNADSQDAGDARTSREFQPDRTPCSPYLHATPKRISGFG